MLPNFNSNGPCYELFNSSNETIKYWKQRNKISKEFETHSKSHIYYLHFGGVSVLSIPKNEKHSILINNPCLLFQFLLLNTKSFSIEIGIKDSNNNKRRLNLTSSIQKTEFKSMHLKLPLTDFPLNIWTNLIIDLEQLTQEYFKTYKFNNIECIHITGCLKIRKIYSLRNKDEPIIRSIDMGKSIPIVNLLLLPNGTFIKHDIRIIGINNNSNNFNVTNVVLNGNFIKNKSPGSLNRRNNSPSSNNSSKFTAASDINANKYRNLYKKNKNISNNSKLYNNSSNLNNNEQVEDIMNITPLPERKRAQMENNSKKVKDTKLFVKDLPKVSELNNEIKYNAMKNIKIMNNNDKIVEKNKSNNNNSFGEEEGNLKERKSLGKYISKYQKNKRRNKTNNPFIVKKKLIKLTRIIITITRELQRKK